MSSWNIRCYQAEQKPPESKPSATRPSSPIWLMANLKTISPGIPKHGSSKGPDLEPQLWATEGSTEGTCLTNHVSVCLCVYLSVCFCVCVTDVLFTFP